MPRTHIHNVSVYYEDTDFSGVVYYANYLRYFEAARDEYFGMEELLRLYKETGIGFAVYKAEVTYREGAKFGDRLEVRTQVNQESDYRLICDQQVWRPGGAQALVKGLIHMVCVDGAQKLVALPDWVLRRVQQANA